ncbi:MAG: threonylcarbamoyl-AMP synthase [Clostridia bacterium]|nr:threonylcarbamoyl-AMP synthase [Clostridia bacterium]
MNTEKLRLGSSFRKSISRAAEILKSGGIVAIPTETVYGLAASAFDENAIKKVFEAKGRPQDNPLIVHISNMDMLNEIASDIPKAAIDCAKCFWPGPLTMVLPRTDKTADAVSAGLDTVAVRMPSDSVALSIINESGLPLAAPSANKSGSPSPTTATHVENDLDGRIDAIVFGDECEVGVESTVISFCCNPPRLLRPGAVTIEDLKKIIPDIAVDKAVLAEPESNERVASPGMKYKHYAPKTDSYLVEGSSMAFAEYVNSYDSALAVCFEEESGLIKIPKLVYGKGDNELSLAHEVFSVLRQVDAFGVNRVFIHAPSKQGVGLAVYNRLIRATGFKVIHLNKEIIGLTGPTGAGKSSLTIAADELGFKVIDCDTLARKAVEKGTDGLKAIIKVFGEDILEIDGSLNRKKLAEKAFSSKENTELLNKTIFPFIKKLCFEEISRYDKVILDAPTLFESGLDSVCTKTIAVLADKNIRLSRIMERDSISKEAALLRMNAGKNDDFYKQNADVILFNNGEANELINHFKNILTDI